MQHFLSSLAYPDRDPKVAAEPNLPVVSPADHVVDRSEPIGSGA